LVVLYVIIGILWRAALLTAAIIYKY